MKGERSVNIIVITLIIILVIGVVSLVMYQKYRYKDVYFNYNGFDIQRVNTKNGVFYYIKMFLEYSSQPLVISMRHDPRTLENISIEGNLKEAVIKKELYISLDKGTTGVSTVAGMEISKIMGNDVLYNIPTYGSMIEDTEDKNITVKTCKDANNEIGVIWLKLGDENKIYNDKDCIIIEGTDEYELIRGADRFVLTLLDIMKP